VYLLFGQQGNIINAIRVAAKKKGIKCYQIPLERFRTYSPDKNSQGVIALKQDFKFSSLDEIISSAKKTTLPLILILDEIRIRTMLVQYYVQRNAAGEWNYSYKASNYSNYIDSNKVSRRCN
jgi:hypothetical protein